MAEYAPTPLAVRALFLAAVSSCGGAAEPTAAPAPRPATVATGAGDAANPPEPTDNVIVTGLMGSLTTGDVHQTMEQRQEALAECMNERSRRLRFIDGAIRFFFKIDSDGRVIEVTPLESDIGHRPLERCLCRVLRETRFPPPNGRSEAEFTWGMRVDPIGRPADPVDPEIVASLLEEHAGEIFETCEVRRRRTRFTVTSYFGRRGRALSAGALPSRAVDPEQLDCVLDAIKQWRLADRLERRAKVIFELK
jgi:hypothetical protein